MSKALEIVLDAFKDLSQKYLPFLFRFIRLSLVWKAAAYSWMARYSRQFGSQAILGVGLLASLYAGFQYANRSLSPESPKASHDVILKSRFSSPAPSNDIVILDIDERTLALLSSQHGRWPWSRDVLADGLQKVSDLGARSVLFNVLLSDPDKNNPDADAVMDVTAQMVRPIAFPLIRLAPQNDAQSQLKASQIPGAVVHTDRGQTQTMAAIIPMFGAMHDRLGVANQKPDEDGIVRKYALRWNEDDYSLPSLVGRTLDNAQFPLDQRPDSLSLNWRNKKGRYERLSFGDLYLGQLSAEQQSKLKNAWVIVSASAPGIGQTKPTGVSSLEDDGEILATALDDAIHDSHLRTMPNGMALAINLLIIWGLVAMTMRNLVSATANKLFVLLQSTLGFITLISASYTHYLIDLSDSMSFGMALFGVIKLVQSLDDRWSRAKPGFRHLRIHHHAQWLMVVGWLDRDVSAKEAQALQKHIEKAVGLAQVARIDDLFGGESFVKSPCAQFKCLLVHGSESQLDQVRSQIIAIHPSALFNSIHPLQTEWNTESQQLAAEIAPIVLDVGARLLEKSWAAANQT